MLQSHIIINPPVSGLLCTKYPGSIIAATWQLYNSIVRRIIYDVCKLSCWPAGFDPGSIQGSHWPIYPWQGNTYYLVQNIEYPRTAYHTICKFRKKWDTDETYYAACKKLSINYFLIFSRTHTADVFHDFIKPTRERLIIQLVKFNKKRVRTRRITQLACKVEYQLQYTRYI